MHTRKRIRRRAVSIRPTREKISTGRPAVLEGCIDPSVVGPAFERYFARVSAQEFYDDVVRASPSLVETLSLVDPRIRRR